METRYFTEDYVTESIAHFSQKQWIDYGETKLGGQGTNLKLVGVRNWPSGDGVPKRWQKPHNFLYGKAALPNIHQAMREGFVELRFSYKPFADTLLY